MKPYSIDFREKVVKAYGRGDTSIRKLAVKFDVSKAFVQRVLKQNGFFGGKDSSQKKPQKLTGHVQQKKQGGAMKSELEEYSMQLAQMVENYPDLTLGVSCEYWGETYSSWYSTSTMCRA